MANELNNMNDKLALMNDEVFSRVYTAGTNAKKFTQQAGKRNLSINVKETSEFVLRVVESRKQPLEVNAKIVCGMSRILLHNLQNILAEALAVEQRSTAKSRIGYKEKNVVRKMKVQLACKPGEGTNGTAVPLDLDLQVLNFDLDIEEKITEKEVIFSLVSCNNATMVKNVDDITMRDVQHQESYAGTQLQLTDDNDFGETMPSERLNFFDSSDETVADSVTPIQPEPAALDGLMDIDLSVNADFDMDNSSKHTPQQILPLEDTLEPLPMEMSTDDKDFSVSSIHEHYDLASNNQPSENAVEHVRTQTVQSNAGLKRRRLIIDVFKQISTKTFHNWISNWSTIFAKRQAPSIEMLMAEQRLQSLFTKPLRDCCNSSKFVPTLPSARKRNTLFDGDLDFGEKNSHRTKQPTANGERTEQTVDKQLDAVELPPVETSNDPLVSVQATGMRTFLPSFTGHQADWDYLKSCEPSSSAGDKQKKNEEGGLVTRYALRTVLDALFAEVPDNSIPIDLLNSKLGNRMIAASVYTKLIELAQEKIIRLSRDENCYVVSVHMYQDCEPNSAVDEGA